MNAAFVAKDIDVVLEGHITGLVNGEMVKGAVTAALNTGRGGRSSCVFSRLPSGFDPATFSTHA